MGKRKYQPDEKLKAFMERLNGALFDEGGNDLAGLASLYLAQETRMTIADFQKLKASSPSFSATNWETVAPSLGLRADLGIDQLEPFTVPIAILPPSFHRELLKNASQWMDVYQEPPYYVQEEARVRLLEAGCVPDFLLKSTPNLAQWYVPICSLFNGRLVDKPETLMAETPETSDREVEHEVFLFGNAILLVIGKFAYKTAHDYYAQVLLELICESFDFLSDAPHLTSWIKLR